MSTPGSHEVSVPPAFLRVPIARLARSLAPSRIVLFGSYAKGTARPGSDVDLLVVTEAAADGGEPARRVRELLAPTFPPVDVVLCTPEEAAQAERQRSPFLHSILESGVTVYAQPCLEAERR